MYERVDFAVRFGGGESYLGAGVMAMNVTNALWTLGATLSMRIVLSDHPNLESGFWQMLTFLVLIAAPLHIGGVYLGRLMMRKTDRFRVLGIGAIASGLWATFVWSRFGSDAPFTDLYRGQPVGQIMVLLLIASGYTIQTIALTIGALAARKRFTGATNLKFGPF